MSNQNGQMDNIDIMPDLENEIVDNVEQNPAPKPCGCKKNKSMQEDNATASDYSTNWTKIALIIIGLGLAYMIYKKMQGGKVEVPKVETA